MNRSAERRESVAAGFVAAVVAIAALHLAFGWAWTLAGGAVGGWVAARRGWLVGGAGGALVWAAFAAWSFSVDAYAVGEMTRVVGSMLGGLPPAGTVALTVLTGLALGAIGGEAGSRARNILRPVAR